MAIQLVATPDQGVWRVARDPDPLAASKGGGVSELAEASTGNRFDSPTGEYGIRYFATELEGCFAGILARYRPDPELARLVGGDWKDRGFLNVGDIPSDWRQRRTAVNVRFPDQLNQRFAHGVQFLDIEATGTREALLENFEPLLAYHHYPDLNVPLMDGRDRRITRYISQWVWEQRTDAGLHLYAGIRYESRLGQKWECWAVFDDVAIDELERRPVLRSDPALQKIAGLYGLTPY